MSMKLLGAMPGYMPGLSLPKTCATTSGTHTHKTLESDIAFPMECADSTQHLDPQLANDREILAQIGRKTVLASLVPVLVRMCLFGVLLNHLQCTKTLSAITSVRLEILGT